MLVSDSDHAVFRSRWQCTRVPVLPHSRQCLFSVVWIIATPVDVKWYHCGFEFVISC